MGMKEVMNGAMMVKVAKRKADSAIVNLILQYFSRMPTERKEGC